MHEDTDENFEIARYTSFIWAADALGDTATPSACEQILAQKKMAVWLLENISWVTKTFLVRSETTDSKV